MKRVSFSIISCIVLIFFGCQKSDSEQVDTIGLSANNNVFVVGSYESSGVMRAKLWEGNLEISLDNSDNLTAAFDVVVVNGNSHVVGLKTIIESGTTVWRPKYWLNGIEQVLELDSAYVGPDISPSDSLNWDIVISDRAEAVFVVGSDVYIGINRHLIINQDGSVIYDMNSCSYKKNGVSHYLGSGSIYDLVVYNNDVYLVGRDGDQAVYWKNNIRTDLTDGSNGADWATGITVHDDNVYVCGYQNHSGQRKAKYWLNGTETMLTTGASNEIANDIAFDSGDIYVCGAEDTEGTFGTQSAAKYWKNGVPVLLTDGTAFRDIAHEISVNGTDVYVSGTIINVMVSEGKIVFWKNGNLIEMNSTSASVSESSAIFITP
ncbi:MAG: hypothetical protein ACKVOR_10840 [Flavobacteriales bacterium]